MKIIDWKLFRMPAIVYAALLVSAAVVIPQIASEAVVLSIVASGLLCLFHLGVGFIILEKAFVRSPTSFLKWVLGGMGVRMAFMLGVLALLLGSKSVDETWLLLGLLVWYSIALVFEIVALQKKVSERQHTSQ